MGDPFFHGSFFDVWAERFADVVGMNIPDRDDEVWRHEGRRVHEKHGFFQFFVHPEGNDRVEGVHRLPDADAFLVDFELMKLRRFLRDEADRRCRKEDDDCKEEVAEEDGSECAGNGDDAERPKPIASALDVLVLVRFPT